MIYDNILQVVGNTPTVRLNRVGQETGVELYAKQCRRRPRSGQEKRSGGDALSGGLAAGV